MANQGPMATRTADSTPPSAPNDTFKTLPNKDSRVIRKGQESGDGKVQSGG